MLGAILETVTTGDLDFSCDSNYHLVNGYAVLLLSPQLSHLQNEGIRLNCELLLVFTGC